MTPTTTALPAAGERRAQPCHTSSRSWRARDGWRWRRAKVEARIARSCGRPESPPPESTRGQPVELVRRDVLIESEEVLRVVAALQSLESAVLLCAVSLADAILTLVHEEVHVDA